jgi:hypothetical protein
MRIERVREERAGEWHRVAADVTWEDRDASVQTLAIETTAPFARDLEPSSDAFLLALLPLAQWLGETRIRVEGRVCSRLRDGLSAAMQLFALWYTRCRPLRIEPTQGFAPTVPRPEPRGACFLSGGIDALSLLRSNRLDYPSDHPSSIRDGILVFGLSSFDTDASGPKAERLAAFEAHVHRMASFAEHTGMTLIPMRTNIRALHPDFQSWRACGFAAGILSTALCMSGRIDRVELGSDGLGMGQPPHSTHPWLNHHYATEAVSVRHAQVALSRIEKTRIVSEWDEALSVLQPCLYWRIPDAGRINCGECEKCLRTMLALVALDKLDRAPTFPADDVTPAMLEPLLIEDHFAVLYYTQCIDALTARKRHDLVVPLRRKIDAYHRRDRRRRLRAFLRNVTGR